MASIATVIDLNGTWASGGAPGPAITTFANSFSVDMSAYGRPTAQGTIASAASISVHFPDDKTYTATLQAPGTIHWSNNTAWTKFALLFDLNGVWASGGVAGPVITLTGISISVDMSAYGRPAAHGKVLGASSITVTFPDAATVTGTLQAPNTIVWSNNSAWTKATVALMPANILDIQNPMSADAITQARTALQTLLAKIGVGNTFPVDQASEWIQPLSPNTEYDDTIVGTTGWAVNPRPVTGDFPFSHPFLNSTTVSNPPNQWDYEFSMAMDRPAANPTEFDYLLSLGNKAPTTNPDPTDERVKDEGIATRAGLNFPFGLLGVEMNSSHIPADFIHNFHSLDRVALFGRWIVDTGHALATQSGAKVQRTEIHPPLLMVAATTTDASTTRAMFTSRPFLTGDTYTTDESKIYVDGASDDGPFLTHMVKELAKVNATFLGIPTESTQVEAHPKIKSFPFRGLHLMHIMVRPPALPIRLVNTPHHLQVSYKFTVRTSCAVEVISTAADTVDVYVVMNQAGYKPPPLPAKNYKSWSHDELAALNSESGEAYWGADILSALVQLGGGVIGIATVEIILGRGIKSDQYASLNNAVTLLDRTGMVTGTVPGTIPQTGCGDQRQSTVSGVWLGRGQMGDEHRRRQRLRSRNRALCGRAGTQLSVFRGA